MNVCALHNPKNTPILAQIIWLFAYGSNVRALPGLERLRTEERPSGRR